MKKPLDKRLLWVSLLLHIVGIICTALFNSDSHIRKQFLVFGAYSKRQTHAYFRPLKAPNSSFVPSARRRQAAAHVQKNTVKKTAIVKKSKPPAVVQKKTPIKKTAMVKKVVAHNQSVKKQPEKKVETKKVQKKVSPPQKEPEKKEDFLEGEEEFLHFNLMGEADPAMIAYQQAIQKEVERVWQPPLGVPKGTECVVTFVVDRQGEIKNFEITKQSQVLIYDLSIVRVAKNFQFDRRLWNKTFTINFRQ